MTTRKHPRIPGRAPLVLAAILAGVALGETGCATPGPLHVYSLASTTPDTVQDNGPEGVGTITSFVAAGETLTGFAYDPFTDHFFLRLAPGHRIRVVDRPARKIKREFTVAALPVTGGGDLTIRPRDGHVFALLPLDAAVVEFTRLGEFIRRIPLETLPGVPFGIAYDPSHNQLLVLSGESPARVTTHSLDGHRLSATITLDRKITPSSFAYDSEKNEIYAPFNAGRSLGVFGEDGRLKRELPASAIYVDVGPRSFLRLF